MRQLYFTSVRRTEVSAFPPSFPPSLLPSLPPSLPFQDATVVKVVIEDLPDESPSLTATRFTATLCEDAVGGEVVELVSNCVLCICMSLSLLFVGQAFKFNN